MARDSRSEKTPQSFAEAKIELNDIIAQKQYLNKSPQKNIRDKELVFTSNNIIFS